MNLRITTNFKPPILGVWMAAALFLSSFGSVYAQKATAKCPAIDAFAIGGDPPGWQKFSTTEYLQITSPNGGEVYRVGKAMTIRWRNCNYPKTMTVGIRLVDNRAEPGSSDLPIARGIPISSGHYRFVIPATILAYGKAFDLDGQNTYTVSISNGMSGGGSGSGSASKAPFTIRAQKDAK